VSKRLSQNQKTFNKVARHLLKQKQKSVVANSTRCLYRGPNGLRCAIGCLIPNRLYNESMEDKCADHFEISPILQQLGHDSYFCDRLQTIHDKYEPVEWRSALEKFTKEYNLTLRP
jgi:hypothetical protein